MSKHIFDRQKSNYTKRKVRIRNVKQRFLIVCEGTKTEPLYFRSFRLSSADVKIIGEGKSPRHIVEHAIDLQKQKSKDCKYDQVWCVFDRDSFTQDEFNSAIALSQKNSIQIAYSNQAFELWYLLHFAYIDTGIDRQRYNEKLTNFLGQKYIKNSNNMYDTLINKQSDAIRNAKSLLSNYAVPDPANDDPSTTVHLLVQELNKFL